MMQANAASEDVLCVDLDGTLIRTDLLHESLWVLLKNSPWVLFLMPFWLIGGKAFFKRKIAERIKLDPVLLPYHLELLEYLRTEKSQGRKLFLASASDELLVEPIARHVGIFDAVLASDGKTNLSGRNKLLAIKAKIGSAKFSYIGNHISDFPLWRESSQAGVVHSRAQFVDKVRQSANVSQVFAGENVSVRTLLRAFRAHQWVKNALLFLPLIMAHQVGDLNRLYDTAIGFLAFCACASGVYLLNDLLDLESDRLHATKRDRPFASGELPLRWGLIFVPALFLISALLAGFVQAKFAYCLGIYFVLTFGYSLYLKRLVLVDILCLASLYTLRVLAGGYAAAVPVSQWLLLFSMFFFLSLACVKRYSELYALRSRAGNSAKGRGYVESDLESIAQFGSASGYLSVLVFALYISSSDVTALYHEPRVLWLICPLLLYWISRVWLLAGRGEVHEDPIVFALDDRASYLVGFGTVLLLWLAL